MPIPANNSFFEQGSFDGYETVGYCRIAQRFQPKDPADALIGPVRGSHLAVIDDPWLIDQTDGRRLGPDGDQPLPLPGEPAYDANQAWQDALEGKGPAPTERIELEYLDGHNRTTVGADGAWLECRDVAIRPGQRLWFHWRFCRFTSFPFNDFAMFLAYPDDRTDSVASHRQVLCDVVTLERQVGSGGSGWSSPWTVGVFQPGEPFRGTLRWLVSNGYSMSRLSRNRPPDRFLRPPALLLDNFSIE